MMWLKGCPRCGGDLYIEHNVGDSSVTCLQCGHVLTEAQEAGLKELQLAGARR